MITLADVDRVARDPAWARRVLVAAGLALNALEGPEFTADGDDSRLPARTALRVAFLNEAEIRERLP